MYRVSQRYHEIKASRDIPQADLDINEKTRANPLKWNGQFSPQLVEALLKYCAVPSTKVFDPFVGSGTVLLESGARGMAAIGTEINPAAYTLASTYRFINTPLSQRRAYLSSLSNKLEDVYPLRWTTVQPNEDTPSEVESRLFSLVRTAKPGPEQILLSALALLTDAFRDNLSEQQVFATWKRLREHVLALPVSGAPVEVYLADARATPVPTNSVDLVITSPPYINVFNYHQQYRRSMEALGWNILRVAKSEIGANRKHRGNRFLTVIQYCLDISQVFLELHRVCRQEAQIILVVGRESSVKGTPFYNGEIITEIGERLGLHLEKRQERVFRNRFGMLIHEDILHFRKAFMPDHASVLASARRTAEKTLLVSLEMVPRTALPELELALEQVNNVQPSEPFSSSVETTGVEGGE